MLQKLDGNAETVGAHLKFRCPLFGETSRASAVVTRVERNTERRRTEPGQAEEHPEPVRPSHLQPAGTPEQMRRIRRPHPPERSAHSWYEFSHENKLLPEHQPPINPGSCRYLFFFFLLSSRFIAVIQMVISASFGCLQFLVGPSPFNCCQI